MIKEKTFSEKYPYITRFVETQGCIEIGYNEFIGSFVKAYDEGGNVYMGEEEYQDMEAALADLEAGIKAYIQEWKI